MKRTAASLLVLAALDAAASACTVCMGDAGSKVAEGANGAIFLMLGFVAFMLSSLGGFIYCLARRARAVSSVQPIGPSTSGMA